MPPRLAIPLSISMEEFERQTQKARGVVGDLTRHIAVQFAKANESVSATALTLAGLSRVATAGNIAIAAGVLALVATYKAMNAVTELGKQRIEELNALAAKVDQAGVGAEFFQRSVESAKDLRVKIEDIEGALKKLGEVSAPKLGGGSELLDRLGELEKFGNFKDNAGVALLRNAQGAEETLRAFVKFFDEAIAKGERLAALDLAAKFLPPDMLARLRAAPDFLQQFLQHADEISKKRLVSDQDIVNAEALKLRLADAEKQIADKFKPIMEDLAKLGVNYQESWVGIYEWIARASSVMGEMYETAKKLGPALAEAGSSTFFQKYNEFIRNHGLDFKLPGASSAEDFLRTEGPEAQARKQLGDALRTGAGMQRGMQSATDIYNLFHPDKSKSEKPEEQDTSAFDRAVDAANRHAAAMEADAAAVGLSESAHARLRVEAALTEALLQDGVEDVSQYADAIAKVGDRTEAAAQKMAESRRAFEGTQDVLRYSGNELVNVLDRATKKGANFGDIMRDVLQNLQRQLLQAAITGEGAFAKMFGLSSNVPGGVGGILGALFGGARAGGGGVEPGKVYKINENTPNSEWFAPGVSGQVIPDSVMRQGGGRGGVVVNITSAPVFQSGMTPTDMAAIESKLAINNEVLRGQVQTDLRSSLRNDSDYLAA